MGNNYRIGCCINNKSLHKKIQDMDCVTVKKGYDSKNFHYLK